MCGVPTMSVHPATVNPGIVILYKNQVRDAHTRPMKHSLRRLKLSTVGPLYNCTPTVELNMSVIITMDGNMQCWGQY